MCAFVIKGSMEINLVDLRDEEVKVEIVDLRDSEVATWDVLFW